MGHDRPNRAVFRYDPATWTTVAVSGPVSRLYADGNGYPNGPIVRPFRGGVLLGASRLGSGYELFRSDGGADDVTLVADVGTLAAGR